MNIYVGNLSYQANEDDLFDLFSQYGEVTSSRVITDRETGRARGFGFIEMADSEAAKKAIEALNGNDHLGRNLKVNEAQPRPERSERRSYSNSRY